LSGQYGTYTPKSSSHHHVNWNSASGAPRHAWRTKKKGVQQNARNRQTPMEKNWSCGLAEVFLSSRTARMPVNDDTGVPMQLPDGFGDVLTLDPDILQQPV
ncbi:MAG: hypothetical protein OXG56_00005, partial [Gammaproteobacteria bacterium]|nr:hypothetical protein [Gammaproteobacteria bacterium]